MDEADTSSLGVYFPYVDLAGTNILILHIVMGFA